MTPLKYTLKTDTLFIQMEKSRSKARHDEAQAINNAQKHGMEKMIVAALQSNAPPDVIESMQAGAGITNARLIELKEQAIMK